MSPKTIALSSSKKIHIHISVSAFIFVSAFILVFAFLFVFAFDFVFVYVCVIRKSHLELLHDKGDKIR